MPTLSRIKVLFPVGGETVDCDCEGETLRMPKVIIDGIVKGHCPEGEREETIRPTVALCQEGILVSVPVKLVGEYLLHVSASVVPPDWDPPTWAMTVAAKTKELAKKGLTPKWDKERAS